MNCIAIDDEPLALNIINDFCSKIDFLELKASCTNAIEALQIIEKEQIDLLFLDIQMPHITGLEFIKTIKNPPLIIFTTAFSEHAIDAYELNAIDYLVKPIPFERFLKAVNKAYSLFMLQNAKPSSLIDFMMVKADYATIKIRFDDVLYIEGLKDYVKIFLADKMIVTKTTMKNIQEKLPSSTFIRIHKSFIVNLLRIEKIENNRLVYGKEYIPIGSNFRKPFFDIIDKFKL